MGLVLEFIANKKKNNNNKLSFKKMYIYIYVKESNHLSFINHEMMHDISYLYKAKC